MTPDEARGELALLGPGETFYAFAVSLIAADALPTRDMLLRFIEKPWKWDDEYSAWVNCGSPQDDSEAGWDAFLAVLDGESVPPAPNLKSGTGR